jgi:hypothetical protein
MSRHRVRTTPVIALLTLLTVDCRVNAREGKPDPPAEAQAARDALVEFDKRWKGYTNEANLGDTRWKFKMETFVRLAKSGAEAKPLLEEAAKEGSSWKPHTRELASEALEILRGPKAVREALASYDLERMDTAKEGKEAPDFTLTDAAGATYQLSGFRDKKTVVVTFIILDI